MSLRSRPFHRALVGTVLATMAATTVLGACSGDDDTAAATSTALVTLVPALTSTTSTTSTTLPPTTTSSTTTTSTTSTTSTTTTTTIPFVTTGATVLVANASGKSGAGSELTTKLRDFGFVVNDPTNAAAFDEVLDVSLVYVLRGSEATAQAVADTISRMMGNVAVAPLPIPPPITDALEGLGDATVVVMLGKDLAGKVLPGPQPAG
jgi:hypothetical protein